MVRETATFIVAIVEPLAAAVTAYYSSLVNIIEKYDKKIEEFKSEFLKASGLPQIG